MIPKTLGESVWDLPPLILHPFNDRVPPATLLENSKAAMIIGGLIPNDGSDPDQLKRRLLAGRMAEVRMLIYLGKDVFRWLDQCQECAARIDELKGAEICRQSFAGLLTDDPPGSVKEKLVRWGVADHSSIFSRAIGLNAVFTQPPPLESLSEEFLQSYHRFADALFHSFMEAEPYRAITAANFRFELYASAEYSRMLEAQWESQ